MILFKTKEHKNVGLFHEVVSLKILKNVFAIEILGLAIWRVFSAFDDLLNSILRASNISHSFNDLNLLIFTFSGSLVEPQELKKCSS